MNCDGSPDRRCRATGTCLSVSGRDPLPGDTPDAALGESPQQSDAGQPAWV